MTSFRHSRVCVVGFIFSVGWTNRKHLKLYVCATCGVAACLLVFLFHKLFIGYLYRNRAKLFWIPIRSFRYCNMWQHVCLVVMQRSTNASLVRPRITSDYKKVIPHWDWRYVIASMKWEVKTRNHLKLNGLMYRVLSLYRHILIKRPGDLH